MEVETGPVKLEVFNPISEVAITVGHAARLDTLQGKTICEVWASQSWGVGKTFPVIRELLQKQFPDANFVSFSESVYRQRVPEDRWIPLDKVGEAFKEKGCDAVVVGNGG